MTAADLAWVADGLRELDRLIAAGELTLAWAMAAFIDKRAIGRPGALHVLMRTTFLERPA